MGLTALFTHLKIILLQYFQFSISNKISCIQAIPNLQSLAIIALKYSEPNLKRLAIIALKDSELTLLVAEKTTILKDLRY